MTTAQEIKPEQWLWSVVGMMLDTPVCIWVSPLGGKARWYEKGTNFSLQWSHNGWRWEITSLTIIYSTVCSGVNKKKHQSPASLAFVRGIRRWRVNSPQIRPVTRKIWWRHHVLPYFTYWYTTDIVTHRHSTIRWHLVPLYFPCWKKCWNCEKWAEIRQEGVLMSIWKNEAVMIRNAYRKIHQCILMKVTGDVEP